MHHSIEKYIEPAMRLLKACSDAGELKKEYKGYIASLGAAIRMSGLVPALAFYAARENNAGAERFRVPDWIYAILKQQPEYAGATAKDLFEHARNIPSDPQKRILEKDILDVSVALKLCIRTFALTA